MGSLNPISRMEEVDKLDVHLYKFEAPKAEFAQMGAYSFLYIYIYILDNVCSEISVEHAPYMVVLRLSPCLECSLCSFGNFPGV